MTGRRRGAGTNVAMAPATADAAVLDGATARGLKMAARTIGIHTICHAPGMVEAVDPAFLAFDVTADPQPERREIAHMLTFWRRGLHRQYSIAGLLSARFTEKTGFDGQSFVDFILRHPDHDVWFVNPYPYLFYLSFNIWEQGEFWHPGLRDRAEELFTAAGMPLSLREFPRSSRQTLLFSNYWVGTTAFWDRFMEFVARISIQADASARVRDDLIYIGDKATYLPFIFERLFTTFLVMHPEIKACPFDHGRALILEMSGISRASRQVILELGPLIDKWDAAGQYDDDRRTIFRVLHKLSVIGTVEEKFPDLLNSVPR
jgi:hypothetical protein